MPKIIKAVFGHTEGLESADHYFFCFVFLLLVLFILLFSQYLGYLWISVGTSSWHCLGDNEVVWTILFFAFFNFLKFVIVLF